MEEKFFIKEGGFKKIDAKESKQYKDGKFNYPNNAIPPNKKGKDYYQMWAEKIYHLCLNGKAWMPLSDYGSIDVMRAYADGRQPTSQYKDWILGSWGIRNDQSQTASVNNEGWDVRDDESAEVRRKAWMNLKTQPVSVAPKIMSKINEHIRSMYYEMSVNAIDSMSIENEELAKYRLWFEEQNREWLESQYALAGIQMEEPVFTPQNQYELELYASSGGFKLPYTVTMEDLLKHTFDVSNWDKECGERIRRDLITLGYAIVKEEFDREMKRVIVRYCDPKFSGMQYSNTNSFRDSEYAYTIEWWEVSKIRQRLNMEYPEAAALAFAFSNQFGNPSSNSWGEYGYSTLNSGLTSYGFDFYKVPVFVFEFIDVDNEQYIQFVNKYGNLINKRYNGEIQDNEELREEQRRVVRQGRWIVGTQHLFDIGIKEYIPRDEFNKPRLSYRAIKLNTIPIIEQIKPFLDSFNLAWIKLQDFIAKAVGNGFAIDVGTLKDISVGKDKSFDPLEVLNFYRQSTFLLYKKVKTGLSGMAKVSTPPVIPIANNTYDNIRAQFESMNFFMQKIEDVTGLSMVALGKSADPNVAKFNMQVSVQGTNEIINNIARAQTDLQEDVSVNLCYRIRSMCRVNESVRKSYEEVVGEQRMKVVVDAEKDHVKYGIKIEATDITEEKQNIIAMLSASIKQPGSGESGKLDISEAILIQDMIMQGQNFRRIGLIIGYKMRKKEQEARLVAQQNIQLQGEQIKQPELIKAQVKQQEQQFELQKMDKDFYYQYMIKWGVPPGYMPPQGMQQGNTQ
jgi:hypothetical protein